MFTLCQIVALRINSFQLKFSNWVENYDYVAVTVLFSKEFFPKKKTFSGYSGCLVNNLCAKYIRGVWSKNPGNLWKTDQFCFFYIKLEVKD